MSRAVVAALVVAIAMTLAAAVAVARPGGGNTYRSSSPPSYSPPSYSPPSSPSYTPPSSPSYTPPSDPFSHHTIDDHRPPSSDSGPDEPESDPILLRAVFASLAIFVMTAIAVWIIYRNIHQQRHEADAWARANAPDSSFAPPPLLADAAPIVAADPEFSLAVFEDFAYQLYAAAHLARGDVARMAALAPYLSPSAQQWLTSRPTAVPRAVVVGAMHLESARRHGEHFELAAKVQANLATPDTTYDSVEHWTFIRAATARTKAPTRTHTWPCPNCGAPWKATDDTPAATCAYCGERTEHGRFDWQVESIHQDSLATVGPTLTGTVDEAGTDAPTVVDPAAAATWDKLHADDDNVTWEALSKRVVFVYGRMNAAWNARDMTPARGLVTSAMLDYLRYWTDEYRRQGLRNVVDYATMSGVELVKVRRDRYYDAVTVRIFAAGNDYTVNDQSDAVVGGSKTTMRAYTEYWTFLRSSTRRGPIHSNPVCSNCGAPLDVIADSGACASCNAVIDNGSFDFVLSKIEQDEVYEG
nr:TIM44-like domain-containing protein [Kofleriaceae bacterium]